MIKQTLSWVLFALLAIAIGLYPLAYFFGDMSEALLGTKSEALLADQIWNIAFYVHISFGGLALLIGWSQFIQKWRARQMNLHRRLGQLYILSVLLSGVTGFYVALFATGGWVAIAGFATLAVLWLFTTYQAYKSVREKDILAHQNWMKRSYALTFGAVTLRLWLPLFLGVLAMDFIPAYRIIAWLAWVPNLLLVEWSIRRTLSS